MRNESKINAFLQTICNPGFPFQHINQNLSYLVRNAPCNRFAVVTMNCVEAFDTTHLVPEHHERHEFSKFRLWILWILVGHLLNADHEYFEFHPGIQNFSKFRSGFLQVPVRNSLNAWQELLEFQSGILFIPVNSPLNPGHEFSEFLPGIQDFSKFPSKKLLDRNNLNFLISGKEFSKNNQIFS